MRFDFGSAILRFYAFILLVLAVSSLHAQTSAEEAQAKDLEAIKALQSLIINRDSLLRDIDALNKKLAAAKTDAQKQEAKDELISHHSDLSKTLSNLENISAGFDMSQLNMEHSEEFNFQKELLALLKPAIDEMKDMTARVRKKSDIREKITYLNEQQDLLDNALKNVDELAALTEDKGLKKELDGLKKSWEKKREFVGSELKATEIQLEELVASETSLTEASQSYLKSFFQQRGRFLTEALLAVVMILLLSRLSYRGMQKYIPGFRRTHRSFRVRLVELIHRILTGIFVIMGPMLVFYIEEDWVLFSLGILMLLGFAWTLRQAVPRYWHQVQLFLNIGSVREGERILMDGMPWLVQQINIFCTFSNPTAGLSQRVPISDLVGMKSRPYKHDEPWFPCRKDDWVILSNGVRGKVTGISTEMIELIERGGATHTYTLGDFLAGTPRNLATNFRVKEIIGITYAQQKEATRSIPKLLEEYIRKRIEEEGLADKLVNLRVEFAMANTSSLDLAVMADFRGELGDLYNRLRRAVQRWCVDACTEYGWEIPFPQMTLSGAVKGLIPDSQAKDS